MPSSGRRPVEKREVGDRVARVYDLKHVDAVEVFHGLDEALGHELFAAAERDARVVVLLVGLLGAVWVPDLALQVRAVLGLVGADAVPKRPLGVRVDVHFDDAVVDGVFDVGHIAAAAAVEDKLDRQRPSREA